MGGGRRRDAVIAALIALACALLLPGVARAETFTVDSTADAVDSALEDEFCETAAGECTLRAAIEEGNSLGEQNRVEFDDEIFEGKAADTIVLGSSLPTIVVPDSSTASLHDRCRGQRALRWHRRGERAPALLIVGKKVDVTGLAITGAQTAVVLEGSLNSKVQGNWLGVALDGAIVGNGTGARVAKGSNGTLVGGEGPGQGNVFAGNAATASTSTKGTRSDLRELLRSRAGRRHAGRERRRRDRGRLDRGVRVTGTAIGTRVTFKSSETTPECDGGCNVISGSAAHGIDLQGDGAQRLPPSIRPSPATTSASTRRKRVGSERRRRRPRRQSVEHGDRRGLRGRCQPLRGWKRRRHRRPGRPRPFRQRQPDRPDALGESVVDPPDRRDRRRFGDAIPARGGSPDRRQRDREWKTASRSPNAARGRGSSGNEIFGSQVGIRTFESSVSPRQRGRGQRDRRSGDQRNPARNRLQRDRRQRSPRRRCGRNPDPGLTPFGVLGNLIGGNAFADENFIADSAGAAIEISSLEATNNEVARNSGVGNAGPFIDLIAVSPGTEVGPNRGIEPPAFSTLTQTEASGGAKPGATVRVFGKQTESPGELDSFPRHGGCRCRRRLGSRLRLRDPSRDDHPPPPDEEGATSELRSRNPRLRRRRSRRRRSRRGCREVFGAAASARVRARSRASGPRPDHEVKTREDTAPLRLRLRSSGLELPLQARRTSRSTLPGAKEIRPA
jgi:CSLREA domain-containing protein